MSSNDQWVTEYFESAGLSFGLRSKGKLHEEQTQFQKLEIFDTEPFGKLMVLDGANMVSTVDNFLYHEMMSHPAVYTHAQPKHVAIIGGGDCGTLREVLKHAGIEKVTQIDIDEGVTRASLKYFPELCESNNDPRAELLFDDGLKWMREREADSLDIIIIDSTDPVGPAEGLFAVDFYRDCFRALRLGGVVVQQTESPILHTETIIKKVHVDMREAGFNSVATLPFPQPIYPSGWWSCTLAGKFTNVKHFRRDEAAQKEFKTKYYNSGIHEGALHLPEFMKEILG